METGALLQSAPKRHASDTPTRQSTRHCFFMPNDSCVKSKPAWKRLSIVERDLVVSSSWQPRVPEAIPNSIFSHLHIAIRILWHPLCEHRPKHRFTKAFWTRTLRKGLWLDRSKARF